jgi:hypothetical protein
MLHFFLMCWRLSGKAALAAGLRRLCGRSPFSHAGLAVFLKHGLECIAAILLFSFPSFALCAPAGPECATKASIEYSTKLQYLSDGKLVYGSFAHMLADDDSPPHAINVATSINGSPDTLFASAVGGLHDLAVDVRNRPNNNKYAWLSDEIDANVPLIDQSKNTADYAHLESMVAKVYPSSDHISTKTLPIEDISSVAGTRSGNALAGTHDSPVIWDGSESSDWATAANWVGGVVPGQTDDVIIDGNYTNAPVLDLASGAVTIGSLTLGENNESLLTISNGDTDTKKLITTNDVTIGGNGTLTHTANSTTEQHKLFLEVGGDMTIKSGGVIDVNEKGYATEQGHGAGGSASKNGSGAGHGGNGGLGGTSPSFAGTPYGSLTPPIANGSGGGKSMYSGAPGGSGGGVIYLLVSGTVTNEGSILANGGNGEASLGYSGGGGSGGSIYINAHTLEGAGTIAVNGGNGGTGNNHRDGGGGGGGRIALHYDTDNSTFATLSAYGGSGPGNAQSGGAGTIVTKASTDTNGHLLVDNNNQSDGALTTTAQSETVNSITVQNQGKFHIAVSHTITNTGSISGNASIYNSGIYNHPSPTLTIPTGLTWYENGTDPHIGDTQPITDIIIDGTLEFQNQNTDITPTSFNSITINNGGILTHQANTNTQTDALNLDLDDLTINQGGTINVNEKGYQGTGNSQSSGYGPGAGDPMAGGGYGGVGGWAGSYYPNNYGGVAYGSVTEPTDLGSSGGSSNNAYSRRGGGAVKISVSGTMNLEGNILARGGAGYGGGYGGGSAGGSVWITTENLTGSGVISADGGNGDDALRSGSGSGGRIALYYTDKSGYSGSISAYGGTVGSKQMQRGSAGTIYLKGTTQTHGDLIIDNNAVSGANTEAVENSTFDNITIQNGGNYVVPDT